MNDLNITFKTLNEVADFVTKVERYPYHMDLRIGSVVVDAKSLMGIMNLGLNQVISLRIHAEDCPDLHREIAPYLAA